MPKTKISEFSATPGNNTDIDGINLAEGCAPSGINDAIRELMAQLKDFQAGTAGDSFNGPVGTSTAAAGAFTTLSSTGNTTLGDAVGDTITINGTATFVNANPTISAGTANGVAYLNASKVLTTGSALTFDGTNLNLGASAASSVAGSVGTLTLGGTNANVSGGVAYQVNGTAKFYQYVDTGGVFKHQAQTGIVQAFFADGSEQMRLTSTGLGIGTSSPGNKLTVKPSSTSSGTFDVLTGSTNTDSIRLSGGGTVNTWLELRGFLGVKLYSDSTNTVTVDSPGNLGLGVTPSAWGGSGVKAIDVGTGASFAGSGSDAGMIANAYYNGTNWIYKTSSLAVRYQQLIGTGSHAWYTAPSGTAGNTISFTQAMTLDASGNLLVGGTSNAVGARAILENAAGNQLGLRYTSVATYYNSVDSSGNLIWTKDGTEHARITSGGYFKASNSGTYGGGNTASYHDFTSTTSDQFVIRVYSTSATLPYGIQIKYTGASPNGTASEFFEGSDSTAQRFAFRSNGGLANYSANNVNLSDRREKTNFAPAKSYLDTICAIPVQTFNYIDQSEDDPGLTLGVVAQDVQAVAPELVMESNWGTEENPKMRLSIYQTDLQYALMKCIQEQQALITDLRARVAQLEGTP